MTLIPPKFVQAFVVDSVVVRDFVDDRDVNLFAQVYFIERKVNELFLKQGDGIRWNEPVVTTTLRQRDSVVDTQHGWFPLWGCVLNKDGHIVHVCLQLLRHEFKRFLYERVEVLITDLFHA